MKPSLLGLIYASMVVLALGGCGRGLDSWLEQIESEGNPDRRREGVLELMQQRVSKSDAAVRLFALVAKSDRDPTVRSAAVQAMGESANVKAVAPLTAALTNDSDTQVRIDAAVALGKVRGPDAVRPLLSRLRQDQVSDVQAACARSLGEYPYPTVVQALVAAMLNDDFSIVFEAQQSLQKLTGESFQTGRAWQSWLDENGDPFASVKLLPKPPESSPKE